MRGSFSQINCESVLRHPGSPVEQAQNSLAYQEKGENSDALKTKGAAVLEVYTSATNEVVAGAGCVDLSLLAGTSQREDSHQCDSLFGNQLHCASDDAELG